MTEPFFILALPRSRTYWLSRFLTYGGWCCHHDLVAKVADMGAIRRILSAPQTGVADTGIALGWRFIDHYYPNARIAIIRRPRKDVEESLRGQGLDPAWCDLDNLERALDEMEAAKQPRDPRSWPRKLVFPYEVLDHEAAIGTLVEHLTGRRLDHQRWQEMRHQKLQIDMPKRLNLLLRNRQKLQGLRAQLAGGPDGRLSA